MNENILIDSDSLDWGKGDGLLPAVVQDADTRQVLMLGYMNREALAQTLATGAVTFFSRSKGRLWTKGESSGHVLSLVSVMRDCDADTLLVLARPAGPTCHLGTTSCFGDAHAPGIGFLAELERVIASRLEAAPEESYTARLAAEGVKRVAQKVGEEGVETALAAVAGDKVELVSEAADLFYHLFVLLKVSDLGLEDVVEVLRARHKA